MLFIVTVLLFYIIHLLKGLISLHDEVELDDWDDYNIYTESVVNSEDIENKFNEIESESIRLASIINKNEVIQNVIDKYENSGIELPLELYAKCDEFTTEIEMINYLEIMRKNYAKNLNMKLVKPAKSAMQNKK